MADETTELPQKPDGTLRKPRTDAEILSEARERFKKCIEEHEGQRVAQKDDLLFCTLDQWPSDIRSQREGDVNGARPCLTIDQINQYIVQVVNDMRLNKPSVKVRPVDDMADIETAEVFQGIIRQIEDHSTAQIAYMTAGESMVRLGEGYFRFVTEYEDEESFNQAIRIKPVPDMFQCYLGTHVMPTGEDAEYGFIFEDIPEERFRRMYPKANYTSASFDDIVQTYRGDWYADKRIKVAEYYYFDYAETEILFTAEGKTITRAAYEEMEQKPEITGQRMTRKKQTKWVKMTGCEILEKRDWPGKYIPIVKVTGKQSWVDGKRVIWGLVRPAKDSLRMYNYWASTITEKIALAPKTPFIMAEGQDEGHESEWQQANVKNFSNLKYKPVSVGDTVVPPPQRQAPAPLEVAMIQQMQQIREDVKASLGMYRAALGQEQPNQSGRAILALTQASDTGTYHFQDNLALSIQHGGRIAVDLVPKYYDTGRVIQILGLDGKIKAAELDPTQKMASRRVRDEATGKIRAIYNPTVGTYDVTVTVGPSYNTKRMEAAAMFTDLSNSAKDPVSAAVVRYLAIKNSDFNGAEEAAEMMEKLLPPGIVKKEGQPEIPPEIAAQVQQMQVAMQELQQRNQELEAGEQSKTLKVQADHDAKMKQIALDREEAEARAQLERDEAMEKAKLEREVAEEKAKLARWEAKQKADLERDVANAEVGMEKEKIDVDKAVKMDGLIPEEERKKFFEGKAIADAGAPLKEGMQTTAKALQALFEKVENSRPTSIRKVKDAQGNIVKAIATYPNGETREITIN